MPGAERAAPVFLRGLRGRRDRDRGDYPESRRVPAGAGGGGTLRRADRPGQLYRRYHRPGGRAVYQGRRKAEAGIPEKRYLRLQKFHRLPFPPEPGQLPDGGVPGPAAENSRQPAGKKVQTLLLRLLLGGGSRLQGQSLCGGGPVPVRLEAEQGGKPPAGPGIHETGTARGLFPDDGGLQGRQRRPQRHLHFGLRSGNQHRPFHGQQPERHANQRRPVRLCAV